MTRIKTSREVEAIRESGHMLAHVLDVLTTQTTPGVTGKELTNIAHKELKSLGGEPVFLGYQGYPEVLCISINDAVVHGIPTSDPLAAGDVVTFDFGVRFRGMITDAARTVVPGDKTTGAIRRLISGTAASLDAGIGVIHDGVRVGDISHAIEQALHTHKLGIVRDLVGHGVGHQLHEDPHIPNYGPAGKGPRLKAGMTIAIEPMATLGSYRVYMSEDGWTIRTQDGSLAAQFEDTVLVTETGYEILTRQSRDT